MGDDAIEVAPGSTVVLAPGTLLANDDPGLRLVAVTSADDVAYLDADGNIRITIPIGPTLRATAGAVPQATVATYQFSYTGATQLGALGDANVTVRVNAADPTSPPNTPPTTPPTSTLPTSPTQPTVPGNTTPGSVAPATPAPGPITPPPTPVGELPKTGSDIRSNLVVAMTAIAAGVLVLLMTRRRPAARVRRRSDTSRVHEVSPTG
jgi:LPXTG-motif cell wall-anchored protein